MESTSTATVVTREAIESLRGEHVRIIMDMRNLEKRIRQAAGKPDFLSATDQQRGLERWLDGLEQHRRGLEHDGGLCQGGIEQALHYSPTEEEVAA